MQPLPYHDDRDHLRRDLLENREHFTFRYRPQPGTEINPEKADHHIAAVLGANYTNILTASIQWIANRHGDEEADRYAAWVDDSITNGTDPDLNADINQDGAR